YNGISIMLLNTFKTCLYNLFFSRLSINEKMEIIGGFVTNSCLKESLDNQGVKKYFPKEYLEAIKNENIKYLYGLGEHLYKKSRPKRILINSLSYFV
ncbi:glycosyltransferase family 2 protein, partial [Bacillus sp. JJ1122]